MTLNEKLCWQCKRQLDYDEFEKANLLLPEEKMHRLWDNPYLQFFCCDCYTKLIRIDVKKLLSSEEEFERALKTNFNPTVWRRFAIICYNKGDYKRTEKAYKRVLELDPSDINSVKNLGYLYKELREINKVIEVKSALIFDKKDVKKI